MRKTRSIKTQSDPFKHQNYHYHNGNSFNPSHRNKFHSENSNHQLNNIITFIPDFIQVIGIRLSRAFLLTN